MKRILLVILVAIVFFPQNLFSQCKKIYLWDVTLSLKGFGGTPDIYDQVENWLIKDINKTLNENTEIIVCPFQDQNGVLEIFRVKANNTGKAEVISKIRNYKNDDVTYTDIAAAMKYARLNLIDNNGTQMVILTDGRQSEKLGGTARLIQEIQEWRKLSFIPKHSGELPPYALFFMLTDNAVDEDVIKEINNTSNIGIVNPDDATKEMYILTPSSRIKANLKDDRSVVLNFTSNNTAPLPQGVKIRVSATPENDFLKIDGEYVIENNQITIPLEYEYSYEELKYNLSEYTQCTIYLEMVSTVIGDSLVNLSSDNIQLTLINKPEKVLKVSIKNN